jgi:hypothetical protein
MKAMKEWLFRGGIAMAGVVLVAGAMILVAPKRLHAVVGALVEVINTPSNPVPVGDINEPALNAYQDFCRIDLSITTGCSLQAVPPGKRLVIQDADISLAAAQGVKPYYVTLTTPMALNGSVLIVGHHLTTTFMGTQPGFGDWFETHEVVHLYVDPSQTPSCSVRITSPHTLGDGTDAFAFCNIAGYLVNVP